MRIDSIDLYLVENKFYRPWRTACLRLRSRQWGIDDLYAFRKP